MKPRGLRNWEKVRAAGMARYVLKRGVLSYGLTMFVLMTFVFRRGDLSPRFMLISAVLWFVGGALFGTLTWLFMEWCYRKAMPKIVA